MALGGALGLAWAPVTPRRFAWQAWHKLTPTVVLRGRRGTNSHPPSFCVAGVALMALGGALGLAWAPVTPRHFAWQAWHKLTPTFVSRGRRGTNSHLPSFHVAGVALMALGGALGLAWAPVTPRHFAWQAWHNLTFTFVSRGRRGTNSHPLSFCVAGVALMVLGGALFVTPHLSYTIFHTSHCHTPSFTHHLSHTTLSHTIFDTPLCHTPLCHTPPFIHHLSHITLSHTFFHTPLCHIPSLTHRFVTPHLSYTIFHTSHCHTPSFTHHLSHTTLSHTIFDTPLCQPLCHTPPFIRHLSHITLSHTFFHTPLCHIPSLTHRFVTHHFVTHHLSHTIFHTPLCHTPSLTHHFVTYHL